MASHITLTHLFFAENIVDIPRQTVVAVKTTISRPASDSPPIGCLARSLREPDMPERSWRVALLFRYPTVHDAVRALTCTYA